MSIRNTVVACAAALTMGTAAWSGPAAAADYTIGVIVPLSGQVAIIGENALRAINLRAEQINAAGGINGHKLKIEAQDDKCEPNTAVSNAQRNVNG